MSRSLVPCVIGSVFLCTAWPATPALAEGTAPFDPSPLVSIGDTTKYGSYFVKKIEEGIYELNNHSPKKGDGGVDIYLIRGDTKALLVDLGNNYIDGYAPDKRAPRAERRGGVPRRGVRPRRQAAAGGGHHAHAPGS